VAKNLIFCFDGTSNSPRDAVQDISLRGEVEDDSITNVLKLHLLCGGDLQNRPLDGTQHSLYYRGIGTYGSGLRRTINRILAPERQDVASILRTACHDLKRLYQPGDQVFLFGFSRGAALARRFAAIVRARTGVTPPPGTHLIRFVGVFDTVASIDQPNLDRERKPKTRVLFEHHTISPDIREALHLVSLDERRIPFQPTLMNRDHRVTEVWFPGVHSDVGGGFHLDGLSDIALDFMLRDLRRRRTGLVLLGPDALDYDWLRTEDGVQLIAPDDMAIAPNPGAPAHPITGLPALLRHTFLADRRAHVIEHDRVVTGALPLVHHAVRERACMLPGYHPPALERVEYRLIGPNGSVTIGSGPESLSAAR